MPFRTVYLHGLVTDEKGQKMSKSKGNVIDPLELIDKYGADALRFTMASLAASKAGRLRLAPARVEGSRNFATKLWNATRFAEMNGAALPEGFDPATVKLTVNKWMLGELARANAAIDKALEEFRLNEAATTLYEFIWGIVCDWYVELTKPILQGDDGPAKDETRAVTAFVLRETVKLLHPVMPFITEELWDKLGHRAEHGTLIGQPWPAPAATDAAADAEMGWLVKLISDIRSARAELNVPAGAKLKLLVVGANDTTRAAARDASRRHRAAGPRRGHRGGVGGAEGVAADRRRRGDLCAAGRRGDRPQGRGRAARRRRSRSCATRSARSTPSSATPPSSRARRKRWSRSSASAAPRPSRRAPGSARRWSGWGVIASARASEPAAIVHGTKTEGVWAEARLGRTVNVGHDALRRSGT